LKIKFHDFKFQLIIIAAVLSAQLLFQDAYILHILILSMIYSTVVTNWDLAIGQAGMFHLAQVPFFVLGGYTSALLGVHLGISPWLGLLAAASAALLLSLAAGLVALRVKGTYLLFLTMAIQFLMLSLVLYFKEWTMGDVGFFVPPLDIFGIKICQFNIAPAFFFALTLMLSAIILNKKILDSKIGLAIQSMRDSETYATCLGVNPYKIKVFILAISSWMTGLAGAFYAHYLGVQGPWDLGWGLLIVFLAAIILGGTRTLYGPALGCFILVFANEYFRFAELFRPTIYSALMIVTILFLPKGLISIVNWISKTIASHVKKI
jgi:branched-chain amino acid transport system permease protein